jgi:hypothetical protein
MMILAITALTVNTVFGGSENANDTIKPGSKQTYVKMQYAGNIGLVSVGAGYKSFSNRFSLDLSLGYLPKFINGIRVSTISLKPSFHFKEHSFSGVSTGFYMGTGINYSIGRNIYPKAPNYYPIDYVYPNAYNLNPFIGANAIFSLTNSRFGKLAIYTELGTVDYEIYYAFKRKEINFLETINLAFGIKIYLTKNNKL